jgi:two-component system, chemotaxis family, sensor kinase CheA
MNISEDISKEELAVFLEETDEELKLLDEDLVLLEQSGVKPEIIQEIFRAAHTLKGSSGMLGYEKMSQVAHAMETVLDKLRSGKMGISTPIINALLSGLDLLKSLREKLVSNEDADDIDILPVNAILEKIANKEPGTVKSTESKSVSAGIEVYEKINVARAKGYNAYKIKIKLDDNSDWMAVRHFQLITELSNLGEMIYCSPSREEIESGKVGPVMDAVLACTHDKSAIKNAVNTVPEINSIEVESYNVAEEETELEKANEKKPDSLTQVDKSSSSMRKSSQTSDTVRVDVKLLDNLLNLVGEMVIDRNRIRQLSRVLEISYKDDETVETLNETSSHMAKIVSDLQENILRARMLHIGTILNGFPRLVRDLAQKANKQIDFIIEGQETELDRSIIEQIRDPLLHILRNAVDHGIETPEKRKQLGKSEKGIIRLSAYHEQSHIVVRISDDGGGIDVEKVKQSAVRKGFMLAEAVAKLSRTEAQNLIFLNGVSTADKVSEVSGRGVGMDVVKTNVSNVGGSITIESKLGEGTTIKLRLPLTLATIDGILVICSGLIYVVPISAIVEIIRLKSEQIQGVMGKEVFRLRENVIPVVRLSERFNQGLAPDDLPDEINIVVIKVGDKLTGLVVDGVMEPQESVVKPLGKFIGSLRGISGATIMGDGQVALILDTATLVKEIQ